MKLFSVVVHGSIYGFDRSRSCRLSPRLHPNTSLRDHASRTTGVPFICGERARIFSCDRPTMPHRSNQVNARQVGKPPASLGGLSSWCARWGSAASRRRTDATTLSFSSLDLFRSSFSLVVGRRVHSSVCTSTCPAHAEQRRGSVLLWICSPAFFHLVGSPGR